MKETLLATLSMMLVMTMSLSQRQSSARNDMQNIQEEYLQMAIGVAKQTIEGIETRAFDQAVLRGEEKVSQFTDESSPNWGQEDCIVKTSGKWQLADQCTAVEDFHDDGTGAMGSQDGALPLHMPGTTKYFGVEVEVRYVKREGSDIVRASPAESPTGLKEVTVRVRDCQKREGREFVCKGENTVMDEPISYSEVFAYEDES